MLFLYHLSMADEGGQDFDRASKKNQKGQNLGRNYPLGPPNWWEVPPGQPEYSPQAGTRIDISGITIAATGEPGRTAKLRGGNMDSYPDLDTPCSGDHWEVRKGGQDAMLIDRSFSNGHVVMAVADGVGNVENGDVASTAVLLGVHEGGLRAQNQTGETRVRSMLQGAWDMVKQCRNGGDELLPIDSTARGPATTLVLADIAPIEDDLADISIFAEGDSSAWLYNPATGEFSRETVDNAPPPRRSMEDYRAMMNDQQQQADAGVNQKSSLTRYLAYNAWRAKSVEGPPCFNLRAPLGSILILCSDGFSDRLKPSSVASTLRELTMNGAVSADQVQHALIQRALETPDHDVDDDCTVTAAVVGSTAA
jgi:serine/threonine protein phosphatase PrpC